MFQLTSLGHKEAQLAIQAVQAEAQKRNKPVAIAVADAYGEVVGVLRMDGARLLTTTVAINKAFTAVRQRTPTLDVGRAARDAKNGFDISYYGDSRFVGWGGGLPVTVDGMVAGAVAVSGLTQEEDIELAQVGVAAISKAGK